MEKIASFNINHLTLEPGVYVSRMDKCGNEIITTYDIRMTAPNREAAISIGALHAIEHLAATYLRNREGWSENIIYWGPMGCCTGNYLILRNTTNPETVIKMMIETFRFIKNFEGDIPGATPRDCGNYRLMHITEAQLAAERYLKILESGNCPTKYPD